MPSASNELRARMKERFGDEIDDGPPMRYLLDRGFENCDGLIISPYQHYSDISAEEAECVDYLCDEWDYCYDKLSKRPK